MSTKYILHLAEMLADSCNRLNDVRETRDQLEAIVRKLAEDGGECTLCDPDGHHPDCSVGLAIDWIATPRSEE